MVQSGRVGCQQASRCNQAQIDRFVIAAFAFGIRQNAHQDLVFERGHGIGTRHRDASRTRQRSALSTARFLNAQRQYISIGGFHIAQFIAVVIVRVIIHVAFVIVVCGKERDGFVPIVLRAILRFGSSSILVRVFVGRLDFGRDPETCRCIVTHTHTKCTVFTKKNKLGVLFCKGQVAAAAKSHSDSSFYRLRKKYTAPISFKRQDSLE
jgi:hypothetical protein